MKLKTKERLVDIIFCLMFLWILISPFLVGYFFEKLTVTAAFVMVANAVIPTALWVYVLIWVIEHK